MARTRISTAFERLRSEGRRGLIVYLTAGDPSVADTVDIVLRLAEAGVDLVELGLPFSDPLADGPVNQAAAERALAAGATREAVVEGIRAIRARSPIPLVLYSYLNPLLADGFDAALGQLAEAGLDGVLVLDLTAEESGSYRAAFARHGLDRIGLVAPTSTDARIARIARQSSGFLYCISREGVTGAQAALADGAAGLLARARRHSKLPLALGFGLSTEAQVREAAALADAVVVGSALVQRFHEAGAAGRAEVIRWAARLAAAAHGEEPNP